MTLTPEQIGEIVTVLVVLGTALANYLNHLAVVQHVHDVSSKVDVVAAKVDGQQAQLASVTTEMAKESGLAHGIALTMAAQSLPPNQHPEAPHE